MTTGRINQITILQKGLFPSTRSFYITQPTNLYEYKDFGYKAAQKLLHFTFQTLFHTIGTITPQQKAHSPIARERNVLTRKSLIRGPDAAFIGWLEPRCCADESTSFSHYFPHMGTYNVTPFSFHLFGSLLYIVKKNVLIFFLWKVGKISKSKNFWLKKWLTIFLGRKKALKVGII